MTSSVSDYLNAPVKNCRTCAHNVISWSDNPGLDHCVRMGSYSDICMRHCQTRNWQPKPTKPGRRSLRRFLLDLLWT